MSGPATSRWLKCISSSGTVRGVAIEAASLIQQLAALHEVKGTAARALGETAIGALLVASYCKTGERINLNIRGTGHTAQALADAYPEGFVRAYVVERENPIAQAASTERQPGPWGEGLLSVLRTRQNSKEPYIGTVPLVTGHLAKDLTFYWHQSEQVPSAVGIAVSLDAAGAVQYAGGFLIQAMPGARDEELKTIERHLTTVDEYMSSVEEHGNALSLFPHVFQDISFVKLEEKEIQVRCDCSRERALNALSLTGTAEMRSILEEKGFAEVNCDFCRAIYRVDQQELEAMISKT